MGLFDGFLLVSDFDGTLIGGEHRVSTENTEAIRYFMAEGGIFSGATGRTEANIVPYLGDIPLDFPWILYNGGAVYDFGAADFVHRTQLDRNLTERFVRRVLVEEPRMDVQIFAGGPFFQANPLAPVDPVVVREQQIYEVRELERIPSGWIKVLFGSEQPAALARIAALLEGDPLRAQVHTTLSSSRYFELTAPDVNKGSALMWLKCWLETKRGKKLHTVAAIGDYTNDIEMLRIADVSGAPCSALPEVRGLVTHVTTSHTEHAVANFISKLELRARTRLSGV